MYGPVPPKSKMLAPSTKNGRRSWRNCSTVVRLTNAGSDSTWPKSGDRKSTRLNSSHVSISYAVFCLKKKKKNIIHFLTKQQLKYHILLIHYSAWMNPTVSSFYTLI